MDKLELKHLAPYLPYGLKGKYTLSNVISLSVNQKDEVRDKLLAIDCVPFFLSYCKPILRPLSDLNKAKLFDNYGDEKLTAIEEFEGNWDLSPLDWVLREVSKGNQVERLLELSYLVIEKLIEHHFDIFGLIEAGLAIDINHFEK